MNSVHTPDIFIPMSELEILSDKPLATGGDGIVFRAIRDDVDVVVKVGVNVLAGVVENVAVHKV